MDPRIGRLASTTFSGRRFSREQIAMVQEIVELFPAQSRRELAFTVCENLDWFTPNGRHSVQSGLRMLERLDELGVVALPAKRAATRGPSARKAPTARSDPGAPVSGPLDRLTPLSLEPVTDPEGIGECNELIERYHYLGYRFPFGRSLRHLLTDRDGRRLGCLLFASATTALPCRDDWLGWSQRTREKRLALIVCNSRFVLFPWVSVPNLASTAMSMALRRIADDWNAEHGYRPALCETFVDAARFKGSCYRAANWQRIGQTQERTDKSRKDVYVHPLRPDFRKVLLEGRPARRRSPNRPKVRPLADDDPFVGMWRNLVADLTEIADDHDRDWQRRRRVVTTLLVMLFVFRLVFSHNHRGYGIALAELWDQCGKIGVPLPQPQPVSAGSMCKARAKVDPAVFKTVHRAILDRAGDDDGYWDWHGHRVHAVDGSKIDLPRELEDRYAIPSGAHYPQGLVSCLYRIAKRIPVDFDLAAHNNERRAAAAHFPFLGAEDVVVYDRGYYSWDLLDRHVRRGLHPVFRLKSGAGKAIDSFASSRQTDRVVAVRPGSRTLRDRPGAEPLAPRLVKHTFRDTTYVLGTTLLDARYTIHDLANLYHGRWQIEEMYKISKDMLAVQEFHARSEPLVRQELFAHFNLVAMARLFANRCEIELNPGKPCDAPDRIRTNYKNVLATLGRHVEGMVLENEKLMAGRVNAICSTIGALTHRQRPGRSNERKSMQSQKKWSRRRKGETKTGAMESQNGANSKETLLIP